MERIVSAKIFSADQSTVQGKHYHEIHLTSQLCHHRPRGPAIARRKTDGRAQYEFYIAQGNGGRLPVEVTSRLAHGGDSRPYGIITATDITDQKLVHEELSKKNALLLER